MSTFFSFFNKVNSVYQNTLGNVYSNGQLTFA